MGFAAQENVKGMIVSRKIEYTSVFVLLDIEPKYVRTMTIFMKHSCRVSVPILHLSFLILQICIQNPLVQRKHEPHPCPKRLTPIKLLPPSHNRQPIINLSLDSEKSRRIIIPRIHIPIRPTINLDLPRSRLPHRHSAIDD